ncbi:MAG: hypothetical protein QME77_10525 [bacterium]|nr:hypothetical protein [bacterium]
MHILCRSGTTTQIFASAAKVGPLPNGGSLVTVDLAALLRQGGADRDLFVQRGDVIVVPQSALTGM